MSIKNIALAILSIIIIILLLRPNYKNDYLLTKGMLEDSISYYMNKDGMQVAKIQSLESVNKKDFLRIKTQDSTITALQKLVKSNKKGVQYTILETKLVLNDTVNMYDTVFVVNNDTVKINCYKYNNKWVALDVCKDSLNLQVENGQSLVFGYDKRKPFVEVVNTNPYMRTTNLRSYNVKIKPKRFGIGVNISYSINSKLQVLPSIGVGLQYNIIRF